MRVIKESANKVTLHFLTLNRQMPVPREDFERRVQNGEYLVV